MAATTSMTLTQYNPYPTATAIATPTGGTFASATYSFLLGCWVSEYHNLNTVGHPLDAAIPALLEGVVVAANDGVTVTWTWPTGVANPDGFFLLRQTAATYTLGSAGVLCLSGGASYVAGSARSATWDAPGSASYTVPAAYPVMTLNPITGVNGSRKPLAASDVNGRAFRQAFQFISETYPGAAASVLSPYSSIHFGLIRKSCSQANRNLLYTYCDQGVHVLLTDAATDPDRLYQYYSGMIADVDGFPVNCKGESKDPFGFTLLCEGVL